MFLHQGLWYLLFILSQGVTIWCAPPKRESKPRNRKVKIQENGVLPWRWVKGISRKKESLRWQLCTKKEIVPTSIWADQRVWEETFISFSDFWIFGVSEYIEGRFQLLIDSSCISSKCVENYTPPKKRKKRNSRENRKFSAKEKY